MIKLRSVFILAMAVLFILSCDPGTSSEKRKKRAARAKGDIVIGIVGNSTTPVLFQEGVKFAIEEINQSGGVIGRKIRPLFYDDKGRVSEGQKIAKTLSANHDVVAVVGHMSSAVAIPVAITYGKNGIVFISPGATHPNLTRYGNEFIFRNIPNDEENGQQIAALTARRGIRKVIVFYERESNGRRLSEIFQEAAVEKGIEIVSTKSFFRWQNDFREMLSTVKKDYEFDAIFIGGGIPASAILIRQARDMGITAPFIGGDSLDSPRLVSIAGRAANGTVVFTSFNPNLPNRHTRTFVKKFHAKFGVAPDTWTAQGYDAIQVLASAIEESGSTVPLVIATTLRFLEDWEGVIGSYSFEDSGDITGKTIYFKEVVQGSFKFLKHETKEGEDAVLEEFTLRLPVEGAVPTIDPGLTMEAISIEAVEQLFLGLTDFNQTYQPVPELARNWTMSEDGMAYRFELRQDAVWTDGMSVTAHDVVWAIQRNIRPETQCPYVHMLYILKNGEPISKGELKDVSALGVHAIDDFTVEFTLEHPAVYFPSIAGLWVYRPLPRNAIEIHGEDWTGPENIQTNGSYHLSTWEKGVKMTLKKNPNYYDADKVSIPEVHYFILPENSVGMAMYKNNELDIMGSSYLRIPLTEVPNIKAHPVLMKEYSRAPIFTTYAYGVNTRRAPVDNPLVRKAISAAIDRKLIIQLVTEGGEEVATTFSRPPVFGAVDPKTDPDIGIGINPGQARKWLAQAGYPDGKNFPEITLMYNASETHRGIAKAIQASLKHYLNVNIMLEEKKWADYVKSLKQPHTPHLFRFGWGADYPDANNFLNDQLHPSLPNNYIGWENMEFAELMHQAERESDAERRKAFYKRAEQILCKEEAAILPIYFETAHCLVKPRIKGWYNMALGGQHIRDWSFEEEQQ